MTPGFRQKTNWRLPMKPFSLLKIPVLLVGFGALLFFSPTCKAQSEVNPDHFDGTDPWEIPARRPVTERTKAPTGPASYQVQNKTAGPGATPQLAAARDLSNPVPRNTEAVQDKRQPEPLPSNKQLHHHHA